MTSKRSATGGRCRATRRQFLRLALTGAAATSAAGLLSACRGSTPAGSEAITLTFEAQSDIAMLEMTSGSDRVQGQVGLDDVWRMTGPESGQIMLRGAWTDETTFRLERNLLGEAGREMIDLAFNLDRVTATHRLYVGGNPWTLEGTISP